MRKASDSNPPLPHVPALAPSEEKFAKAFRSTPDAVVITDRASGRFIEVNAGFERQFGWSKDQTIGRSSLELGIWVDPAQRQVMLDTLQRDGSLRDLEVHLKHRDGQRGICLLKRADIALYRAKDSGRNAIQIFRKTCRRRPASAFAWSPRRVRTALPAPGGRPQ